MVSENPKTSVYDEERLLRRIDELSERASQLERDLARSHRLAMLGTLVGTIAHEFNNLLTPVMSYAQLALHDLDDRDLVSKALGKITQYNGQSCEYRLCSSGIYAGGLERFVVYSARSAG